MESSLAKGYVQKDSNEYIGLAYTQLGDYEKGMEYFLTALKDDSGDLLLLTIGQTYYQMKRTGDAVDYLLRTLNKTEDKDDRGAGAVPPGRDLSRHGTSCSRRKSSSRRS